MIDKAMQKPGRLFYTKDFIYRYIAHRLRVPLHDKINLDFVRGSTLELGFETDFLQVLKHTHT